MKDHAPSPAARALHFFDTEHGAHVLAAEGSRIFDVPPDLRSDAALWTADDVEAFLSELGVTDFALDQTPRDLPMRSISLAVAQKCNLGCSYCYASGGDFGGPARNMPWEVAQTSIDTLLRQAAPGDRVNIAFLGGEPLINRALVRRATVYAAEQAESIGVAVGFSITTNGTLVTAEDGTFFEKHGFAVTVSLDGLGETHDALRPFKGGRGSFDTILARIEPLLTMQRRMQVGARVTVTPRNMDLPATLDRFVEMGFHSVGFSPMLASPTGTDELAGNDFGSLLEQMIACGQQFEAATAAGRRYPFSNMTSAMQELHRGTHRPYPCGAGAGYFGVSADGGLFACHRFVDDPVARLGDATTGADRGLQSDWLTSRHVERQSPCSDCWARYLCGGGCHHEVIHRGRPACDYIRGWLDYCLQAYVRLCETQPGYFGNGHS